MRTTPRFIAALCLSLGLVGLTACSAITSALGIFLVKFSYVGSQLGSLVLPQGLRDASTVVSPGSSYLDKVNAGIRLVAMGLTTTPTDLQKHFTDKSNYGINLGFLVKADNSQNSDRASFQLDNSVNLFVQDLQGTPIKTGFPKFAVAGRQDTTLTIPLQLTLGNLPQQTFQSVVAGDSIPYRLQGEFGFNLVAPGGASLGSETASMDLITDKVATRPSKEDLAALKTFGLVP